MSSSVSTSSCATATRSTAPAFTNARSAEQTGNVYPQEPPYRWRRRHDEYGTAEDAG